LVKKWVQSDKDFTLEKFLKKISYYEKYNIAINRQILKASTGGIQVLTAHQAKGLEYSIVCMPGLTMNSWEKKRVIDQLRLPTGIV
jgi:ATP-dependent exoDNAse (exonuclease V) beta subunit